MSRIQVFCPTCGNKGDIEVSEEALVNVTRGLLAVNIAKDSICTHAFIAYIDKNQKVRDYFMTDFQIEVPEIETDNKIEGNEAPEENKFDLDLIKINLPPKLLSYIIRSIFLKKKVIIISDDSFLISHILNFFKFITQDTFNFDITIISPEECESNKDEYKDYMIFNNLEIINNVDDAINPKDLAVEQQIIYKFLKESEPSIALIVLKNEILKLYNLSKSIGEFAQEHKEKLSEKKITDFLVKNHGLKIQKKFKNYFNLLLEIVTAYFEVEIATASRVANFLEEF